MKQAIAGFIVGVAAVMGVQYGLAHSAAQPAENTTSHASAIDDLTSTYYGEKQLTHRAFTDGPFSSFDSIRNSYGFSFVAHSPAYQFTSNDIKAACILSAQDPALHWPALSMAFTFHTDTRFKLAEFLKDNVGANLLLNFDNSEIPYEITQAGADQFQKHASDNPADPDFVFAVKDYELGALLEFYQIFFPHQPPKACSEGLDLSVIPHWDELMQQVWKEHNY